MNYTVSYPKKRTYEKYDESHFLLYLNEPAVEIEKTSETFSEGSETPETVPGFSYTGEMQDGGTLVEAKQADYGSFVSGLIRTRYSSDDVEALQGNMLLVIENPDSDKSKGYKDSWDEFQAFRNDCKKSIKKLLGL
ncbi:hypothetical protein EZS27_029968 [termite gut metagenome]|uniref:Uncharacterized protein n=1 Tax=termite gut metagenome TaxID=433724 RepID=A0A5J4QHD0_9ZZZZ